MSELVCVMGFGIMFLGCGVFGLVVLVCVINVMLWVMLCLVSGWWMVDVVVSVVVMLGMIL